MKIKTLVAAVLLSCGATATFAQNSCNANLSIAHEAVRAGNYKDAYVPCMAVLKECPTLKYYTFKDATTILTNFLKGIKDRNSADYKKYFDELMGVHDLKMHYLPEFAKKFKPGQVPTVDGALGTKAVDYILYAPQMDLKQAYAWLTQSVNSTKGDTEGAILHYFLEISMKMVQADSNHTDQFFQDYLDASKYVDEAIANETKPNKQEALKNVKENLVAMFINSGVADCESLQNIYGAKVEENKGDSTFLKKTIAILKMMKCNESEVYFRASEYMYKINPTPDAAVGVAYMYYKTGDYNMAVQFFDEALTNETDPAKKSEMAYATALALLSAKKYAQARSYCQKAISFNESFGDAYILMAQAIAGAPNWSDEPALNKCTFFLVIDKLQRAKQVNPECAERAQELINTYAKYTPATKDLFMLGIKAGDRVTIGGWIGESTVVR